MWKTHWIAQIVGNWRINCQPFSESTSDYFDWNLICLHFYLINRMLFWCFFFFNQFLSIICLQCFDSPYFCMSLECDILSLAKVTIQPHVCPSANCPWFRHQIFPKWRDTDAAPDHLHTMRYRPLSTIYLAPSIVRTAQTYRMHRIFPSQNFDDPQLMQRSNVVHNYSNTM